MNNGCWLFGIEFYFLPTPIDFSLFIEVNIVSGYGLGGPTPLDKQSSEEEFELIKTFWSKLKHHIKFKEL